MFIELSISVCIFILLIIPGCCKSLLIMIKVGNKAFTILISLYSSHDENCSMYKVKEIKMCYKYFCYFIFHCKWTFPTYTTV